MHRYTTAIFGGCLLLALLNPKMAWTANEEALERLRQFVASCPDRAGAESMLQRAQEEVHRRGIGHLIYGRVELLDHDGRPMSAKGSRTVNRTKKNTPPDPRTGVRCQTAILPGGHFIDVVKDLDRPVGFRLHGYAPHDLDLNGKSGDIIDVGVIPLHPLQENETARLVGSVRSDQVASVAGCSLSLHIGTGPVNTPSNGTDGSRADGPRPVELSVNKAGHFSVSGCSPAEYLLVASMPHHVQQLINVRFEPGQQLDLGEIVLEKELPLQITYLVDESLPFDANQVRTASIVGGARWKAVPDATGPQSYMWDLEFKQQKGQILMWASYYPCRIKDLGVGTIQDFVAVNESEMGNLAPRDLPLEPDHVYLLDQGALKHWVLFKVDVPKSAASRSALTPEASTALRTWRDATGNFSLKAQFVELKGTDIRLLKEDGVTISVPLTRLSDADQQFVRDQQKPKTAKAPEGSQ